MRADVPLEKKRPRFVPGGAFSVTRRLHGWDFAEVDHSMKKQFSVLAGIVAVLAVVLAVALSMTASKETKKSISENIPHGANEKPLSK
jgi:hypothetical protein